MNIVIPIAGTQLIDVGSEKIIKQLYKVYNFYLIEYLLKSIDLEGRYIFIIKKEDDLKYNFSKELKEVLPTSEIIVLQEDTLGALDTVLKVKELINNEEKLIISNSDYWMSWDNKKFLELVKQSDLDGILLSFKSTNNSHAFIKTNKNEDVIKIFEKKVIGDDAAVGFYFWKTGKLFVECAESRIRNKKNESYLHYICPVYNELIDRNGKVKKLQVDRMFPFGNKKDIQIFKNYITNERY
jgi:dTDP-glucose pyrophosphorylase